MLDSPDFKYLKNINLCGVMGMATFTDNMDQIRGEFRFLRDCHFALKKNTFGSLISSEKYLWACLAILLWQSKRAVQY